MWFTDSVQLLVAFTAGLAIFAVGEYLAAGLRPFTLPIGGTLTLGADW